MKKSKLRNNLSKILLIAPLSLIALGSSQAYANQITWTWAKEFQAEEFRLKCTTGLFKNEYDPIATLGTQNCVDLGDMLKCQEEFMTTEKIYKCVMNASDSFKKSPFGYDKPYEIQYIRTPIDFRLISQFLPERF